MKILKNIIKKKDLSLKVKCIIFITMMISSIIIMSKMLSEESNEQPFQNISIKRIKGGIPNVIVHLDLKGSPLKLSYLQTLLPMFRKLGVTGLLMEYEDMFPYENKLKNISAENCYSKPELQKFLIQAKKEGFDIIPLIQTFGHMEHVLKLKEFQHLRENPTYPDSICPSKKGSLNLIRQMIQQVVQFHSKLFPLKYFHIGCDEVYHINSCPICINRLQTSVELYLHHIKAVADIVNQFTPDTAVLVWDDMFREIPMSIWDGINSPKVELVYWDYKPSLSVTHITMMKYHRKFENLWIASAFKGADGKFAVFPDLENRFSNNYEWLRFIDKYVFGGEYQVYEFKGIILTGWSRYSHMEPPCELLPVGMPSLVFNLVLIKKYKTRSNLDLSIGLNTYAESIKCEVKEMLKCSDTIKVDFYDDYYNCTYNGNVLYHILKEIEIYKINVMDMVQNELSFVEFYSKSKSLNKNNIYNYLMWCRKSYNKFLGLRANLRKYLNLYYDSFFVEEYIGSKLYSIQKTLHNLTNIFGDILEVESWRRGPHL